MPWTPKQVRYLESSSSPLTPAQKSKMNAELHADPSLGHHTKGSTAMKTPATHLREMRIEIHRGPKKEVTGYTVHHQMEPTSASKSGAFMDMPRHEQPFSAKEHDAMVDHVTEHLDGLSQAAASAVKNSPSAEAAEETEQA